jgi:hypothetical protein
LSGNTCLVGWDVYVIKRTQDDESISFVVAVNEAVIPCGKGKDLNMSNERGAGVSEAST